MRQQFAQIDPARLQATYEKASEYDAALQRIYHSPDPEKQWNLEAAQFAPELVGRFSKLRLQQMISETETQLPIMGSILQERGVGLPGAPPATEYKEVGGNLYAIDPYAPPGKVVTPVTSNPDPEWAPTRVGAASTRGRAAKRSARISSAPSPARPARAHSLRSRRRGSPSTRATPLARCPMRAGVAAP